MQLLYGTYNPAKLASMRKWLAPLDIELIGLSELAHPPADVEETGETPLENARIKAVAYRGTTGMITLAADSGLYLDGVPEGEQPGVHARRIGKEERRLSDEEMIDHYGAWMHALGGQAVARYRNALCLAFPDGRIMERFDDSVASAPFLLVDTPHQRRTAGFPLDSLSVDIQSGQYYYDLLDGRSEDDLSMIAGYFHFVQEALDSKA